MAHAFAARRLLVVLALAGCVAACGKPENDGYTQRSTLTGSGSADQKTPAPPLPAWAGGLIGQPLSSLAKGSVKCRGYVDVAIRHIGAKPGIVIEGWAWDINDGKPLSRVLFIDSASRVIGAADVGKARQDVMRAMPMVKSPAVGWSGVTHANAGMISAVGLTAASQTCVIASREL